MIGLDLLTIASSPRAAWAFLTWPKFSLTSFRMVSALVKQGIVPKTVIDVGANIGQFTVASAKLFPSAVVHAFEPLPDCAKRLQHHASRVGKTRVYEIALGEQCGSVTFRVNTSSYSSSVLPLGKDHLEAFPHAMEVKQISVAVSTLDTIFSEAQLVPPVLLKIDVQGYEAQVLRGGTNVLKRIDYVVLEASFKPMYEGELLFTDLLQLMGDRGFIFLRPVGWLLHPKTREMLQIDALFRRVV